MSNQTSDNGQEERLGQLVSELEEMLAAGSLDPGEVGDRFDELFVPSEDIWLVHFIEVPFSMKMPGAEPDAEEFTPWVGVIIDAFSGEMIFAHTTETKPEPDDIAMFLLANMVDLGSSPAAIDIIDEEVGAALANVTAMLGIELGVPEEELEAIQKAMEEFATGITEQDMILALSDDGEEEGE